MKKILMISLLAICVGSSLAFFLTNKMEDAISEHNIEKNEVTAFQIGVYSILNNAKKTQSNYPNSLIYKDEDKYRVFIAIYKEPELIEYMESYYDKENVDIYLKKIKVNKNFSLELDKYEELLKKSKDKNTYISANKNILEAFKNSL